jgi:hypothetical protein
MNAALQPCLMAMEMPAGEGSAVSSHASHSERHSQDEESGETAVRACQHCPPSISISDTPCATSDMSGCEIVPDFKQGDRFPKLDVGDGFFVVVVSDNYSFDYGQAYVAPFSRDSVRPNYSSGPPINLKHCVFLI